MMRMFWFISALVVGGIAVYQLPSPGGKLSFTRPPRSVIVASTTLPQKPRVVVTHRATPVPLRAIYMTSCVAATPSWRASLVKLISETELNAVVIDIKDYTGMLSFPTTDTEFIESTNGCFVKDMRAFVAELHEKGIYVIGRAQVFQDKTYTKLHPDMAVKKRDGSVWKDRKGLSFIDVGSRPYWNHMVSLSQLAYNEGFDEINYDYVRYPSDGDLQDIVFTQSGTSTKPDMLETFFAHLHANIPKGKPYVSVDLFGMTTVNTDDLNIGQVLERAFPYVDYIAPMVYPSHFPAGFNGWKNPNTVPGEIIAHSMGSAVKRANAASTSPSKLRPWLQDFDYGGIYDAAAVRAQIQATYDVGLDSWMLWDPGNKYTRDALKVE